MSLLGRRHGALGRPASITINMPELAGADDAACLQLGASFGNTDTILTILRHTSAGSASVVALRFQIPNHVTPATITSVKLSLAGANAQSVMAGVSILCELSPAAVWANTTSPRDRPDLRYTDAVTAGVTPVTWNMTASAINTRYLSPDIKTSVIAAMNGGSYVPGTSYVGIIIKAPIGTPPLGNQVHMFESTVLSGTLRPLLEITY